MKPLFFVLALCLLAPAARAAAQGGDDACAVMVVDWDVHGTNMRDAPAGKIISVIPVASRKRVRMVAIEGQSKGWFRVTYDGKTGWMHGSVLGTCAAPTEDGNPVLSRQPDNGSPASETLPSGAPVSLLDMRGGWLKVRYTDAKGRRHEGWLPQQSLALSEDMWQECAASWAKR